MERIHLKDTQYLRDPGSWSYRAYMAGARAMLKALELLPESERAFAYSVGNDQHLLGLLVRSEELQQERRRQDAQRVLCTASYDKYELAAFLLDAPKVNPDGCLALEDGTPLEDFTHRPLLENPGWPRYTIQHHSDNDWFIDRKGYCRLPLPERANYSYDRQFKLGQVCCLKVSSNDTVMMKELLKSLIRLGDKALNDRLLFASTPLDPGEPDPYGTYDPDAPLVEYRAVITETSLRRLS